jgi:hypothetical protein
LNTVDDKKFGHLVILEETEIFVKVYRQQDGEDSAFWYPKSKLVPVTPKQKQSKPVVLNHSATDEYTSLISYLQRGSYSLHVMCLPHDVDRVSDEYTTWSGETLPDDNIKPFDNRYGREWVLQFKYEPTVIYPFPIIELGTGGGQGTPCGLHRAGTVSVYYSHIIKELVCAGLRVN